MEPLSNASLKHHRGILMSIMGEDYVGEHWGGVLSEFMGYVLVLIPVVEVGAPPFIIPWLRLPWRKEVIVTGDLFKPFEWFRTILGDLIIRIKLDREAYGNLVKKYESQITSLGAFLSRYDQEIEIKGDLSQKLSKIIILSGEMSRELLSTFEIKGEKDFRKLILEVILDEEKKLDFPKIKSPPRLRTEKSRKSLGKLKIEALERVFEKVSKQLEETSGDPEKKEIPSELEEKKELSDKALTRAYQKILEIEKKVKEDPEKKRLKMKLKKKKIELIERWLEVNK